jgi:hypothetical protein
MYHEMRNCDYTMRLAIEILYLELDGQSQRSPNIGTCERI